MLYYLSKPTSKVTMQHNSSTVCIVLISKGSAFCFITSHSLHECAAYLPNRKAVMQTALHADA